MNAHLHGDSGVVCYDSHDPRTPHANWKLTAAGNLMRLVVEHRENCPGEDCTVSLMTLLPIYTDLVGAVSDEERAAFL